MSNLLLLEDDISLIDGLHYSLKKNGFYVDIARTVEEAEKQLAQIEKYDLLILDVTLPDGTGFVAVRTVMPDVTAEMLDWWFMWHGLEGLRYKIWCPGEHYDARVRPEDLPRRLDTTLSLRERNWGTTDLVTENVGGGPTNIFISFQSPQQYGYDMSRFSAPNVLTAISANAGMSDVWEPNITFSHCARPHAGGGIELRSRFWQGWNVVDGVPIRVGSKGGFPVEVMRDCACHCAAEYSNLAAILPTLYAENHGIVDTAESLAAGK